MATRELLPIRQLHKNSLINSPLDDTPFSRSFTNTLETTCIYEDNASCIVLSDSNGTKVCTKHISLKGHHFKYHLCAGILPYLKLLSTSSGLTFWQNHLWNLNTKPYITWSGDGNLISLPIFIHLTAWGSPSPSRFPDPGLKESAAKFPIFTDGSVCDWILSHKGASNISRNDSRLTVPKWPNYEIESR